MQEDAEDAPPALPTHDLSTLVIPLLKGVMYQEGDANYWHALLGLQARVRDYVGVLGLALHIDEAEGFAYLRARPEPEEPTAPVPRLVARRPLTFQVSLMLALLRKKLLEFDAVGGDTRLVLSRDELVEMVRVFLPQHSNEARLIDQIDTHLNKVVELGFLRRHKSPVGGQSAVYEVRRILKAFVDAQWLGEFDERLAAYQAQLASAPMQAAEASDE
ncbi:DUF4194 domain-containing protein [Acidovorax sp. LjRoot118]|uniref:DUF4194 domain-containing protein n=1 Tax=Acidovorax sp. LjRoot118 TaxID=3342256 RepID=UPI003ECD5E0A